MGSYMQETKKNKINQITQAVKQSTKIHGGAMLTMLRTECLEKLGLSPSITNQYLKEIKEMGLIEMDEEKDTVKYIGIME